MPQYSTKLPAKAGPTSTAPWVLSLLRRALVAAHGAAVEARRRFAARGLVAGHPAGEVTTRSHFADPRRLAKLIGFLGALCLIGMIVLAYAHSLTRRPPAWWVRNLTIDPTAGEEIETGLMGHLSAVRAADPAMKPGETWRSESWSVSLKEKDANAWLNARLPIWLANRSVPVRWPSEVASLQVRFENGVIRLGAEVLDGDQGVIAGVSIEPVVREDGSLWLRSSGLNMGSLPAPAWAIGLVRSAYSDSIPESVRRLPETKAFFGALAGSNAIFEDAAVRLDGGRRVRLLGVTARQGRLDLTFRTERPNPRLSGAK